MLSKYSPIGFIPTMDADRARRFYVDILKLQFETDDQFALVVSANGVHIRIVRLKQFTPAPYTILGWDVPDLLATVSELAGAGISFLRYAYMQQDDFGIWTAPSGSRIAWFQDPDGNVLSLSQN